MKKLLRIMAAASCLFFCFCEPVIDDQTGTIYGIVTDYVTGNPVSDANVYLQPNGRSSLTGSDGYYQFVNVGAGEYSLVVSKADYRELIDNTKITLSPKASVPKDVQIERLPSVLRLVSGDGSMNDIASVNFDGVSSVRAFSIFNGGAGRFEWEIENGAEWISVSPSTGSLSPGAQQSVTVTIDRSIKDESVHSAAISIVTYPGSGVRNLLVSTRTAALSLAANPANGGTVSRSPNIDSYAWGAAVTITAVPTSGYKFVNWTAVSGQPQIVNANSASTEIILNSDAASVVANFQPIVGDGPVTGKSLAAQLLELHTNAVNGGEYVIELTGSENIGGQPLSFTDRSDITIRIIASGTEKIVTLADNGSLFTIGSGITLILDNMVTLSGRSGNNAPLVRVNARGTLTMKEGAKITKNNTGSGNGGGVFVATDGVFIMEKGEITDNNANNGGGVYVAAGGYFEKLGGRISGNKASNGGGVYLADGTFKMTNGEILSNTASVGGGVYAGNGTFTMEGGKITSNVANTTSSYYGGGGVYAGNAAFTMAGGEISINTAPTGGGVYAAANAHFVKTAGTIFGYALNEKNRNTATTGINGSDRGHAVFVNSTPNKRRETTAGPTLGLNSNIAGAAGGWE